MKIDILGSCVTRDSFSFVNNNYSIGEYFSRTSIISLYSRKLNLAQKDIKLPSKFQKRMVYFDFAKRFRSYIKNSDSDYLIIDLIDERLKIGRIENSYITISNEFLKSKIDLSYIKINNKKRNDLWLNKVNLLIEDLKYYGADKVILHKAFWKDTYIDSNNRVQKFDNLELIQEQNSNLEMYYHYIENALTDSGLNIIEIIPCHADSNHKWGLEPFHYEKKYYDIFMNKLKNIIQ